ncbi:3-hydroxyacyl-ACP dehydratase FabZ family protein [Paenibacillus sp. FJAT-26967]|uniref:3-hydroxyacyl-ACP dehydratase FabZ family protein n=1 Tax=Paenibacillus sp. FJAT-26967 TaxID=1729690 RepID=UPI000837F064|nr:FabA-like domain protein [Paenibacillus sp. FJAT-26967]
MSQARDWSALLTMLPHQYPLRLIDEVRDYSPGEFLTASFSPAKLRPYCGDKDEIPPAILIEGLAQTCVIMTQLETEPLADGEMPLLGAVKARIACPVYWDQLLLYKVNPVRIWAKKAIFSGVLYSPDGKIAVTADLSVAVTNEATIK